MAWYTWAGGGGGGSGCAPSARHASSIRATKRFQASGAASLVPRTTPALASSRTKSSVTKSARSWPAACARPTSSRKSPKARSRWASNPLGAGEGHGEHVAGATVVGLHGTDPLHVGAEPRPGVAGAQCLLGGGGVGGQSILERRASRASRVGNRRYRVAIPTPARWAISSRGTSTPRSANAAVAAATSAGGCGAASARSSGRSPAGPGSCPSRFGAMTRRHDEKTT
jgi:hypothetical protein